MRLLSHRISQHGNEVELKSCYIFFSYASLLNLLVVLGIPILSAIFQTLSKDSRRLPALFFETTFVTRVSLTKCPRLATIVGQECQRLNSMYKSSHNLNGVDFKYVTLSQSQTRRSHDMVFNHLSPRTEHSDFLSSHVLALIGTASLKWLFITHTLLPLVLG